MGDLIRCYRLNFTTQSIIDIPPCQIMHDRDGLPEMTGGSAFMKAPGRLMSVKRPIANLIAVYEARNVIYLKRGAVGFVVAAKTDETGTVALEKDEKQEL